MMTKESPRLYVDVKEDRFFLYGTPGFKARVLAEYVKRQGVSDSVKPGLYTFDIKRRGFKIIQIFTPVKQ